MEKHNCLDHLEWFEEEVLMVTTICMSILDMSVMFVVTTLTIRTLKNTSSIKKQTKNLAIFMTS